MEAEIDGILSTDKKKKRKLRQKHRVITQSTQQMRDTKPNTEISKGLATQSYGDE